MGSRKQVRTNQAWSARHAVLPAASAHSTR